MEEKETFKTYLAHKPDVQGFFDADSNTISYVVSDPETKQCAIIDSVLDYEPHGASIGYESADAMIQFIKKNGYEVAWILETHVHADHLSAAPYLKEKLGGKISIGKEICSVQEVFGKVFNEGTQFQRDGSQFDKLWEDNEEFFIGNIPAKVIHTPGHTPADVVYVIGDALFAGDTMFMPDYGTARCDFPGGSSEILYSSVQKIFELPDEMRMFMCHDYLPEGRTEYVWETTVGEQRTKNIHLKEEIPAEDFIKMRTERDSQLGMPRLIIPSIQVNMRGGELPKDENTGEVHLKTPVNSVFSKKK